MSSLRQRLKNLLPSKLQFRFINAKHTFTKFKQIHYSQNGEDIILNSLFPEDYRGFYVDVGAHHPYRISNTALLHERGWRGINVDANPETIKMFKRARPNDINLNIGVSGTSQTLTYHCFSDPAVNTFSEKEATRWKHKKWLKYLGNRTVKTLSLAEVLNDKIPDNQTIDVLNVDVEGLDLEVLKSNDWQRFRPRIIIVEDHSFSFDQAQNNDIYKYLCNELGYVLDSKLAYSLLFKQQ